jgi:hypothetical protein
MVPTRVMLTRLVPTRVATSYVVRTRVVQSYSKEVQFLPTCCEQRVTYLVIGISDLELESTFLEHLLVAVGHSQSREYVYGMRTSTVASTSLLSVTLESSRQFTTDCNCQRCSRLLNIIQCRDMKDISCRTVVNVFRGFVAG